METTRHFVATCYVVVDGAVALHHHDRLGLVLPPGGHVDRDELPHETAVRETVEETGLEPRLLTDHDESVTSPTVEPLPTPRHLLLEDINVCDGAVGHQHIDHVYYGVADSRDIEPVGDDEAPPAVWDWYDADDLRTADLDGDVTRLGLEAIEAAAAASETDD
jgi:8-oxo-dGTP pyrophosphatase MutT (NUDIX family)